MEVIYVIGPENGPYKIGFTKNLKTRLAAFCSGSPVRLSVHLFAECADVRRVEGDLHETFSAHSVHGEWFEVELSKIEQSMVDCGLDPQTQAADVVPLQRDNEWALCADYLEDHLSGMSDENFKDLRFVTGKALCLTRREYSEARAAEIWPH